MRSKGRAEEGIVVHVRLRGHPWSLRVRVRAHRAAGPGAAHTGCALRLHTGRSHYAGRTHRMGRRCGMVRRADHVRRRVMGMRRGPATPHVGMRRVGRTAHHSVGRHRMRARRGAVEMWRGADPVRGRRTAVGRRCRRLRRRQIRRPGRARTPERRQRPVRHVVELGERRRRRRHRLQWIRDAACRIDA